MNTGVEAVETAIKLCRKWAYEVKKFRQIKQRSLYAKEIFMAGQPVLFLSAAIRFLQPILVPICRVLKLFLTMILPALEKALENKNVAGFLVEPIQGEAGVMVPENGYLSKAKKLCEQSNVLFIADEIQTGLQEPEKCWPVIMKM